jgi:hypothetical protein
MAVNDIAIHIAHPETVRHSRCSLKTADQGNNVHIASGLMLGFFAALGRFIGLAAGTVWFLAIWKG